MKPYLSHSLSNGNKNYCTQILCGCIRLFQPNLIIYITSILRGLFLSNSSLGSFGIYTRKSISFVYFYFLKKFTRKKYLNNMFLP